MNPHLWIVTCIYFPVPRINNYVFLIRARSWFGMNRNLHFFSYGENKRLCIFNKIHIFIWYELYLVLQPCIWFYKWKECIKHDLSLFAYAEWIESGLLFTCMAFDWINVNAWYMNGNYFNSILNPNLNFWVLNEDVNACELNDKYLPALIL